MNGEKSHIARLNPRAALEVPLTAIDAHGALLKVKFDPLPDITPYEMAVILSASLQSRASGWYHLLFDQPWASVPHGVKRHLSIVEVD